MPKNSNNDVASRVSGRNYNLIFIIFLLLAIVAGLWGRFYQLGVRELALDEYFFVQSIKFILNTGLPEFPDGGFYVRGFPIQYLTALSVKLFGDTHFAYRLPIALISLVTVWLTYLLARKHINWICSSALVGTLLISSWEIEFARFTRMYTPLQCITVGFLLSLHFTKSGKTGTWILPFLLAAVSPLFHKLGIINSLVLALYVTGNMLEQRKIDYRSILTTVSILTFAFFWSNSADKLFFSGGPEDAAPPNDFVGGSFLVIPQFPFWSFTGNTQINLLIICLLSVGIMGAAFLIQRQRFKLDPATIISFGMLPFAAAHQLTVVGLFTAILVLRFDFYKIKDQKTTALVSAALSLLISLAWFIVATTTIYSEASSTTLDWKQDLRETLFGWPDFYADTLAPWLQALPIITVLICASLAVHIWTARKYNLSDLLRNPLIIIFVFGFFIGFIESHRSTTRYFFFFYPISLLSIIWASSIIFDHIKPLHPKRTLFSAGAFLLCFGFSSEFQPKHLFNIATPEVGYRLGEYQDHARLWYGRQDYVSSAEFITKTIPTDQALIISGRIIPIAFYINREFSVYYQPNDENLTHVTRDNGTVHKWTSMPLYYTPSSLQNATKTADVVWLAKPKDSGRLGPSIVIEEVWGQQISLREVVHTSLDDRIEIIRIELSN